KLNLDVFLKELWACNNPDNLLFPIDEGMPAIPFKILESRLDFVEVFSTYVTEYKLNQKLLTLDRTPLISSQKFHSIWFEAVGSGKIAVMDLFLLLGMPIDSLNSTFKTALSVAAARGKMEVIQYLTGKGASIRKVDGAQWSSLHEALKCPEPLPVLKHFLELDEEIIDEENVNKMTALTVASREGKLEAVELFLSFSADPNGMDVFGNRPLHYAAQNGYKEICLKLLEAGAVNDTNLEGKTPAKLAKDAGFKDIFKEIDERSTQKQKKKTSSKKGEKENENRKEQLRLNEVIRLDSKNAGAYLDRARVSYDLEQYSNVVDDCNTAMSLDLKEYRVYYYRGLARAGLKQYKEAIEDYSEAVKLNNKDAGSYYNRGLAYAALGKYKEAIEDYNDAIKLEKEVAVFFLHRGVAYAAQKDYKKATADFDKAILLKPKNAIAYYNRGLVYAAQKDYEKANADFNKAIELKIKDFAVYYNRGLIYAAQKDYGKAIADFDKAIRNKLKNPDVYYNRGLAFAAQKDHEKAVHDFTKAIELKIKDFAVYYNRGLAYAARKDYQKAANDFTKVLEFNSKDNIALCCRADAENNLGFFNNALDDCNDVIRRDSKNVNAYLQRGIAFQGLRKFPEAIADFSMVISLEQKNSDSSVLQIAEAFRYRGAVKIGLDNQYKEAISDFNEAITRNPNDSKAYAMRAFCWDCLGEFQKALDDCDKAIGLEPENPKVYNTRGRAYVALKEYQKGIDDYSEAIRLTPQDAMPYCNRGIAYLSAGFPEKAIEDFDENIRLNSQDPASADAKNAPAYRRRAAANNSLRRYREALSDAEKAVRFAPKNPDARHNRGVAKSGLGDYEGAIADFTEAINLIPSKETLRLVVSYNALADAKNRLGRCKDAIEDANKVIGFDSKNAVAYAVRGTAKSNLGLYKEAMDDFNEAFHLDQKLVIARVGRAFVKIWLKRYAETVIDFKAALRDDPNSSDAYAGWGFVEYTLDHRTEETALQKINKALELDVGNAFAYLFRGIINNSSDCYADAISDFSKALSLHLPTLQRAEAYRHRGMAYYSLSRNDEAILDFNEAVRLNPALEKELEGKKIEHLNSRLQRATLENTMLRHALQAQQQQLLNTQLEIPFLASLLGQPEGPLKAVSLVHLKDSLDPETVNRLRERNVLLTLENLKEASESCLQSTPNFAERSSLRRLGFGIQQLLHAWRNGTLKNEEARLTLDKEARQELYNLLSSKKSNDTTRMIYQRCLQEGRENEINERDSQASSDSSTPMDDLKAQGALQKILDMWKMGRIQDDAITIDKLLASWQTILKKLSDVLNPVVVGPFMGGVSVKAVPVSTASKPSENISGTGSPKTSAPLAMPNSAQGTEFSPLYNSGKRW
ncbi:MAG: tetratricopeptide repeat protein, partial [Proteobacteria bacterium]|nr:tetratricopeptide repeat protein [Pseudomonadota bacterium]